MYRGFTFYRTQCTFDHSLVDNIFLLLTVCNRLIPFNDVSLDFQFDNILYVVNGVKLIIIILRHIF